MTPTNQNYDDIASYLDQRNGVLNILSEKYQGLVSNNDWSTTFETIFKDAQQYRDEKGVFPQLLIPAQRYNLSRPWILFTPQDPQEPLNIQAPGAILNQDVIVCQKFVRLSGMTVEGSPNYGFRFLRGYGSGMQLLARKCGKGGFYFPKQHDLEKLSMRGQTARSIFIGCGAEENNGDGWILDGTVEGEESSQKSWTNANLFDGCYAIKNKGRGLYSTGMVNYNTFVNLNIEGNTGISVEYNGHQGFFFGGHFVDKDAAGVCVRATGNDCIILGGRLVGEHEGFSTVIANTPHSEHGAILKDTPLEMVTQAMREANQMRQAKRAEKSAG